MNREKIVRDYLNKHDVYSGFLLDVLKVEYTPTVDEPYLELLVPVHTSNTYGHVLENATALRIVVGERWKGFAPKKQFDGIQDYVDPNKAYKEAFLKNIPKVGKQVGVGCTLNVAPIQLQHKLPEEINAKGKDLTLYEAVYELQNIVEKLLQEKTK